jgi:hypothetical protein
MKQVLLLLAGIGMALTSLGQTDSTEQKSDTIRIGNMIIIKKRGAGDNDNDRDEEARRYRRRNYKPSNISTNWGIVDLGFGNYIDDTQYGTGEAATFAPGLAKDDFKLRPGKSTNVNVWIVMQRLNVAKHVVNLKYGVGLEMWNFRYKRNILYDIDPTQIHLDADRNYEKNKLAAEYVTAPIMLNFNFTPTRKRGFGFSAGVSAGYLLWSRQKTVTSEDGKQKTKDDFDLRPFKISYIAELTLGPVKLYGSYALKSMFEKGLDQRPYAVGFRLSNW